MDNRGAGRCEAPQNAPEPQQRRGIAAMVAAV